MDWKHDDLAMDLAIAKGGIPFLNVCLGSPWCNGRKQKTPRADLVVCRPSYRRFCLSVFEVKVTRADFLSDIRSGKWRDYLPHCDRFYFAVAKGVLKKADIPKEAGLIVRGQKGWVAVKAAPVMQNEVPVDTLKALIFAKQRRSAREKRIDDARGMNSPHSYMRRDFSGKLKSTRVLGKKLGWVHEAAMQLGGLTEALDVLHGEAEIRRTQKTR